MKRVSFVWSCFVMTFFVACQQAEVENPKADDLRMSIVASIKGQQEMTDSRYEINQSGVPVFKKNEAIGVFFDEEPVVKWTYLSPAWSPSRDVFWPDRNKSHDIRAFSPYIDDVTSYDNIPMPLLTSQTGIMEDVIAKDFLVTAVKQTYGEDGVVSFKGADAFAHVSSMLQLTLTGDGDLSASTLKRISIACNDIVTKSTYSFTEGVILDDAQSNSLDLLLNHEMNGTDVTYYFIVNAKDGTTDNPDKATLTIEYERDETTYEATLEQFAENDFAEGVCQQYTLSIKDGVLLITGADITAWESGGSLDEIIIVKGEEKES